MDYSLKDAFKSLKDLSDDVELKHQKIIKESLEIEEENDLNEGYIGQTVKEFLEDCLEPETIEKIVVADNDAADFTIVYEGNFYSLPENILNASFDDFDCGGDKVVINVAEESDFSNSQYYETVASFIEDFNGDEIEIQEEGKVLFSGDKYDMPEGLEEYAFISYDAPKYICINARDIEIEEFLNEDIIEEKYSESFPKWFIDNLKGKNNPFKKFLLNKNFDLNKAEFIEAELPKNAWDPNFKREDIYPIFYLNVGNEKYPHYKIYIKGINDSDEFYNYEKHKYMKFKNVPVKDLIGKALNYGYITTDPSNFSIEKQIARKVAKKGMEERGKGQYKQPKYISGYYDPVTGNYISGHYDENDYTWVTNDGEDKSGYLSKAKELKKRLYSADLNNYSEKLNKFENRLEDIRKEINNTIANLDLKTGYGSTSYLDDLIGYFKQALYEYKSILKNIDNALKEETKDEQDEAIQEIFNGNFSNVKELIYYIEKAERKIKDYHSETESLEEDKLNESWVHLTDEEEVKEEIEKKEKEKEETPIIQIVDPSATIVDELQDNYLGYATLSCNDCKTVILKKPDELIKEETVDPDSGEVDYLYNVGFECPHCGSKKGYELLGQIATLDAGEEEPVEEVEEEKVEVEEPLDVPELEVEEEVKDEKEMAEKEHPIDESLNSTTIITDLDEVSFDKHINKYLKEVYDNVTSYETTDGSIDGNTIIVEGKIKFTSGKEQDTSFKLKIENKDNVTLLSGLNETFANNEDAYQIKGKIENNNFITEDISFKYEIEGYLLEGYTKEESLIKETNVDEKNEEILESLNEEVDSDWKEYISGEIVKDIDDKNCIVKEDGVFYVWAKNWNRPWSRMNENNEYIPIKFNTQEEAEDFLVKKESLEESINKTIKFGVPTPEFNKVVEKVVECGFGINELGETEGITEFEVIGDAVKEDCWKKINNIVEEINKHINVEVK